MCIDDFALRKGRRYATVMVDIESRKIVDILESRECIAVIEWLKTYPNIEVVSRDGSPTYSRAIAAAHPKAIQVSDRFHLVKGLTEAARLYIKSIISSRIRIEADAGTTKLPDEYNSSYWSNDIKPDLPEREHHVTLENRRKIAEEIGKLASDGQSVSDISRETGYAYLTIKGYLSDSEKAEDTEYGVSRPSILDPYSGIIDQMLTGRKSFREIEAVLRQNGYTGAASTIRMYATRKRKRIKAVQCENAQRTEIVERKWLNKLLYKPIEDVSGLTSAQLEKVLCEYPALSEVYKIVCEFKKILFSKKSDHLHDWIDSAKALNSPEINSFVNGVVRDIEAIKNAIRLQYNNGLAEGSICKIKLTKRIMYGRCSFDLLKAKLLN